MSTGTPVNTGDVITAAKMNLKQETGALLANLSVLDQSGIGTEGLAIVVSENLSANRNLTITVNDAARAIDLGGNLTLAAALTTTVAAVTLAANAAGSSVTLPATGTLATLAGSENLTSKTITSATLSGTFPGSVTFSGATITLTGGTIALTGGAAYTLRTTDAFALNLGANGANRLGVSSTIGQFTVYQTTFNYTLAFSDPAAARVVTFPDPGGNDSVTYIAATQTLTNKTITAAALSGTFTGTPTFSGAVTLTASPLNFTAAAAFTLGTTDANTLIVKTGNSTRWTFAAASSNITAAGAADIIGAAATASAVRITDGATAYVAVDTRVAVDNVVALTLTGSAPTIASVNGTTYSVVSLPAVTLTLTGGTQVTALNGLALNLARPVVTSAAATTVVTASTLYIANSPSAGGVGPASITNNYALHVAAGTTALQATTLLASPLNFTAGGAFVFGTTDAQTLALKTGGTNRWTWAAASASVTLAGAASIAAPAATAAALNLTDGTTSYVAIDTRVAVDNIAALTLTGSAPTIASANGTTYSVVSLPAVTLTLTGGTQVTALNGLALNLARPVVTSAAATTVVTASTLYIANSPSAAGGGPVSITNNYALHVAAGISAFAGNVLITANTLNFTAGGAFTLGTTDANTLIVKTGGSTRWTFAAASSNLTAAGATVLAFPAATAATLAITDGTTSLIALDSRVAVDNTVTNTLTNIAATFASAAGSTHSHVKLAVYTLTLTGGTGVTALDGLQLYIDAPTVTSAAATVITTASTVYIKPPTAAGGGPASFTNSRIINTSVAGCFLSSAGTWTDASSRDVKHAIRPVDFDQVLQDIQQAQAVTFIKDDPSDGGFRRYGFIAEDVPDYMASVGRQGIGAVYMAGAAFAGVQALLDRNMKLEAEIAALKQRLETAGIA